MVENPSEGVVYLVPFTSYDLLIDRDSISTNLQVNVGYFFEPEYPIYSAKATVHKNLRLTLANLMTLHVSHPYINKVFTWDRNILSFTLRVSFRDYQTGHSCAKVGQFGDPGSDVVFSSLNFLHAAAEVGKLVDAFHYLCTGYQRE